MRNEDEKFLFITKKNDRIEALSRIKLKRRAKNRYFDKK